jgi:hypothetical protein
LRGNDENKPCGELKNFWDMVLGRRSRNQRMKKNIHRKDAEYAKGRDFRKNFSRCHLRASTVQFRVFLHQNFASGAGKENLKDKFNRLTEEKWTLSKE